MNQHRLHIGGHIGDSGLDHLKVTDPLAELASLPGKGERGAALLSATHRLATSLMWSSAYEEARYLEQQALRLAEEIGQDTGYYMWMPGWTLLIGEPDYEEAEKYLSAGSAKLREEGSVWLGAALASLGRYMQKPRSRVYRQVKARV